MSAWAVAFLGALIYRHRQLLPVLKEHLESQEGEILSCLLLGDVMRWMIGALARPSDRPVAKRILRELEEVFGSDEELQGFIVVGFLENLPRSDEPGSEIRSLLGRRMDKYLRERL